MEIEKLRELKRIVAATNASVVLSSDWRRQLPLKQRVQRALERLKIPYVGCTSQQTKFETHGNWRMEISLRPREITDWIRKFRPDQDLDTLPWVAIDDRDLIQEAGDGSLDGHFVLTEAWWGLTAERADAVIAEFRRQGAHGGPLAASDGRQPVLDGCVRETPASPAQAG